MGEQSELSAITVPLERKAIPKKNVDEIDEMYMNDVNITNGHTVNDVAENEEEEMYINNKQTIQDLEGINEYLWIESILKSSDGNWKKYLHNFQKNKIDDEMLSPPSGTGISISRTHTKWVDLIPDASVRDKVLNKIYDTN